jgi:hypothetical protein
MVSAILEGRVRRMPRCLETQPGPRSAWYQPRVAVVLALIFIRPSHTAFVVERPWVHYMRGRQLAHSLQSVVYQLYRVSWIVRLLRIECVVPVSLCHALHRSTKLLQVYSVLAGRATVVAGHEQTGTAPAEIAGYRSGAVLFAPDHANPISKVLPVFPNHIWLECSVARSTSPRSSTPAAHLGSGDEDVFALDVPSSSRLRDRAYSNGSTFRLFLTSSLGTPSSISTSAFAQTS